MTLDEIVPALDDTQRADILANLDQILQWELQQVRRLDNVEVHQATADLLQSLIDTLTPEPESDGSWIEVKTINGKKYEYKRWREGGKLRSQYMGKVQD